MGRHHAVIDWARVDKLLKAQCEGTGIAATFGIHPDTLYHACERKFKMCFSAYAAIKRSEGVELLREIMYDAAMNGDKTMQIWLSKQYLDMKEKSDLSGMKLKVNISEEDIRKIEEDIYLDDGGKDNPGGQ